MNKFIQSTKQFFNKKPVRIIVALLIIAAIMTGISFGVIALVKALSDPCAKQPGTTWDKDLKVCVKDSCQMDNGEDGIVCKAKGKVNQCIAKDYCDYSGPEGQYSYDEDSCGCKLDCSSLGEEFQGFTTDGRTEVSMQLQSDGTYKPQPDNILYCGSKCEYSEIKNQYNAEGIIGGINWCKKGFICGKNLNENEDASKIRGQCYDENIYNYCDEPNNDNVVCKISGKSTCNHNGPNGNARCNTSKCGEEDSAYGLACKLPSDCTLDGTIKSGFTCDKITDKKFQHIGICSKTDKLSTDQYCIHKDKIGENFNKEIIKCDDNHLGISSAIKQCSNNTFSGLIIENGEYQIKNYSCTKSICSNNEWQAAPNNIQDQCMSKDPEICTNAKQCNIDIKKCCDIPYSRQENSKIKKGCCNESLDKNPNCLLTTNLPFEGHFLDSNKKLGSQISCNYSDYSKSNTKKQYDKKLRSFLNVESDDETVQTICLKDNYIHGQCGGLDIDDKDLFGFFPTTSKTEICTKKQTCNINLPERTINPVGSGGNDLIICEDNASKKYWGGNSTTKGEKNSYGIQTKSDPKCSMSNYVAYLKNNTSLLNGLESIEPTRDGSGFKYTWNCNDMQIPVNGKFYNWNSLAEPTYIKSNPDIQKLFPDKSHTNPKNIKIARNNISIGQCNGVSSFPEDITKSFYIKNPLSPAGDCSPIKLDDSIFLDSNGYFCQNNEFNEITGNCK